MGDFDLLTGLEYAAVPFLVAVVFIGLPWLIYRISHPKQKQPTPQRPWYSER